MHRRLLGTLVAAIALTIAPAGGTAAATPSEAAPGQVVTVRVATASSTTGTLEGWRIDRGTGEYRRVLGPFPVFVGEDGVGPASEYTARTPAGTFTLTESFGSGEPPRRTRLPYVRTTLSTWWVSDVTSRHYNTMRTCAPGADCGFDQARSEQLGAIRLYRPAIVIDYNRDPVVPGAGSAFFIHLSAGEPTQGCISMDPQPLRRLLRWLRPGADPVVSIGVGAATAGTLISAG